MDAGRCYNGREDMPRETLVEILSSYASYAPHVGYCQGMNYIAGTLFIYLQDEAQTFAVLAGLIEKYNMESLLNEDLYRLKLYFYMMDRLIGVFLPMLHKHFRDEMINSAHFSSSWFITLFSSIYEPPLLLKFWDMFLAQGWKAIFRIGIVIL